MIKLILFINYKFAKNKFFNYLSQNLKSSCLIILLLSSSFIFSQDIITDRPDQTESPNTLNKGALQIESGYLSLKDRENKKSKTRNLAPTNLFRYGLTNIIELRLLAQFENQESDQTKISGISDIELGVKLKILKNENINNEISFLSTIIIPSASNDLSLNSFGISNRMIFSHTLSSKTGLGYNLGYDYLGSGKGNLTYTLAIGTSLTEKLGFFMEPFGEIIDLNNFILNFDSGFTYLLKENFQLDCSYGMGINNKMNFFSLGISWLIKKNKENQ